MEILFRKRKLDDKQEWMQTSLDMFSRLEQFWLASYIRKCCLPGFPNEQAKIDKSFEDLKTSALESFDIQNLLDNLNLMRIAITALTENLYVILFVQA